MQLKKLIEAAASKAGGYTKLAEELDIPHTHVSGWKAGTRTCSAEYRALMADIAGTDPIAEVVQAIIDRSANKSRGDRIKAVLLERLGSVGNSYVSLRRLAALCQAASSNPVSNT